MLGVWSLASPPCSHSFCELNAERIWHILTFNEDLLQPIYTALHKRGSRLALRFRNDETSWLALKQRNYLEYTFSSILLSVRLLQRWDRVEKISVRLLVKSHCVAERMSFEPRTGLCTSGKCKSKAWALSLVCARKLWLNKPQQHWRHDACDVTCNCCVSRLSAQSVKISASETTVYLFFFFFSSLHWHYPASNLVCGISFPNDHCLGN